MSIIFSCVRCRKRFEVAEELAGKKARCKQCGTVATIPAPVPVQTFGSQDRAVSARPLERPGRVPSGEVTPASKGPSKPWVEAIEVDSEAVVGGPTLVSAASLACRAFLAVMLMFGFYALALTAAGAFLYLLYTQWRVLDRTHQMLGFGLTVVCGVGAGVILWSIVPRFWNSFDPKGIPLDPDEHPRLFEVIDEVAGALGQDMPAAVYLVADVNAWVTECGGLIGMGGQRVMGVGLSLMQVLTVSQFRGVLAHEFAHYSGGDTMLGPWVFGTRDAIIRTIVNLKVPILRTPFLWYFNLFLHLTQAVSRHQEYCADAQAARVAGSRAMINGLRRTHAAGAAFGPFWASEVAPALSAGYRPPLSDGFDRFLRAANVSESLQGLLRDEIGRRPHNPYDTHPPLRERIRAIRNLPPGSGPADDPPAITLLERVPRLEAELLVELFGEEKGGELKPVRWEDVGGRVYLPRWKEHIEKYASVLSGMTPRMLPALARNVENLGQRLARCDDRKLSREDAIGLACATVGAALAVTLMKRGWSLDATPGTTQTLKNGQKTIEPFEIFMGLATGTLSPDSWEDQCLSFGILDHPL